MKEQLLKELRQIECQLSPENLTCDGEASASYVRKEYRRLTRERTKVIKKLGYEPSLQEIFPEFTVRA